MLQVVKHQLLNRDARPCEPSSEYNFANCIEKKVVDDIGCRPRWLVRGYKRRGHTPVCKEKAKYQEYTDEMTRFTLMDKTQMQTKSGCLKPCEYMEYRVKSL